MHIYALTRVHMCLTALSMSETSRSWIALCNVYICMYIMQYGIAFYNGKWPCLTLTIADTSGHTLCKVHIQTHPLLLADPAEFESSFAFTK